MRNKSGWVYSNLEGGVDEMASRSLTALGDKAEQSLAAVTSFVSVVHEKTVVAFRCNKRGCERVIHPMLVLAVMVSSITLVAVATGTRVWVEVSVCRIDPFTYVSGF